MNLHIHLLLYPPLNRESDETKLKWLSIDKNDNVVEAQSRSHIGRYFFCHQASRSNYTTSKNNLSWIITGQFNNHSPRRTQVQLNDKGEAVENLPTISSRSSAIQVAQTLSNVEREVGWLLACLTSQQHANVPQRRICADNFTCCPTEIEVADPTFYLT